MRVWQRCIVLLIALAALGAEPDAHRPYTVTSIMPVVIEIAGACRVRAGDLDFGSYDAEAAVPALGQTVIELRCSAGTTAEILLDAGTGALGNTSRRQMKQESGLDRMDYDLYQDPARRIHWGDRSGRDTLEVAATGSIQPVPVYGAIPARQQVRDGNYSDTITVTVRY